MWYRGLQLVSNANRDKIDVVAKTLLIGPQGDKFTDVSFTVDLSANGVNGLDIGNQANNQWYDLVAVLKRRGGLARIDGMFVKSGDTPVFPPRYSAFDRLSSHRNNGSGDLYRFINAPDSNWFEWNEDCEGVDFRVFDGSVTTINTWESVDASAVVSPTSRRCKLKLDVFGTAITNVFVRIRNPYITNSETNRIAAQNSDPGIAAGQVHEMRVFVETGVNSSQNFQHNTNLTAMRIREDVMEYEDIRP